MQIPFDCLPGLPRLFLDYVRDPGSLAGFFREAPSLENVEKFARGPAGLDPESRKRLAAALGPQQVRWSSDTSGAEKLGEGAVAVVTGQQAGLFTGPLLSVFKALTAVKLSRELERRGVPAVPVFWIAADDHDHEEIAWAGFVDQDSEYQRVYAAFENDGATPAAWLRYAPAIDGTIREYFESLPASEWHDEVRQIVEEVYRPGASPVEAFAGMMSRLFRGTGLVIADPMDPALRSLAAGVLARALEEGDRLRKAVLERTRAIREAGYAAQVSVDETFTGLFLFRDGSRVSLDPDGVGSEAAVELSPNVLLRPVVQDALFPTAAYIAGPAEVAYLAQAGAIYEQMGRPMPPVCPRITATLIEPPVARIMRKYDIAFTDVLAGVDQLRRRTMTGSGDQRVFAEVGEGIRAEAERLRPVLEGTDKTLGGALDNSIDKLSRQIESLKSRFVAARARRDEILDRQLVSLGDRLYPEKKLQERAVNITSFLVRYGPGLTALLDERVKLDGSCHQIVEI